MAPTCRNWDQKGKVRVAMVERASCTCNCMICVRTISLLFGVLVTLLITYILIRIFDAEKSNFRKNGIVLVYTYYNLKVARE